ncbi:MAG: hypothetical protein JSU94_01590, partial [Phycisphaerales bacterium]
MNKSLSDNTPAYRAVLAGHGSFVPEKILTNEDLAKMVDTSDEWITTRTGIKVRHITTDNETTLHRGRRLLEPAEDQCVPIDVEGDPVLFQGGVRLLVEHLPLPEMEPLHGPGRLQG